MGDEKMYRPVKMTKYLLFKLNNELYGIENSILQNTQHYEYVITLIDAPNYMHGAIKTEGTLVPVIDLRVILGSEETQVNSDSHILIVKVTISGSEILIGIAVDALDEMVDVCRDKITARESGSPACIKGVIDITGGKATLLHINKILSVAKKNKVLDAVEQIERIIN